MKDLLPKEMVMLALSEQISTACHLRAHLEALSTYLTLPWLATWALAEIV